MTIPLKKSKHTVRAVAVLTGSYVAGTVFSVDEQNYLGVLVKYTKGDETSISVKIESSIDGGTTYGRQAALTNSGGTVDVDAATYVFDTTGNYWIPISPIKADTIKVSALATGGTPTGTLGLDAVTGWV